MHAENRRQIDCKLQEANRKQQRKSFFGGKAACPQKNAAEGSEKHFGTESGSVMNGTAENGTPEHKNPAKT
ncbi:MAG: hypothetical protein FWD66_11345 [Paludibacter sp.]|nr:hypothetical protein [Paludibacter sp.]